MDKEATPKQKELTYHDGFYYLMSEGLMGDIPDRNKRFDLPPERLALVKEDLAAGKESLVWQFMVLQLKQRSEATQKFDQAVESGRMERWLDEDDDAPESHASRVRAQSNKLRKDGGRNWDLPLSEVNEELRRQMGLKGSPPYEEPADGDKRDKPGYDRGGSGRGRG